MCVAIILSTSAMYVFAYVGNSGACCSMSHSPDTTIIVHLRYYGDHRKKEHHRVQNDDDKINIIQRVVDRLSDRVWRRFNRA